MSKTSSGNAKYIIGAVIAVIIAIAAIVAISQSGSSESTGVGVSEFSEITVSGDALPSFDTASAAGDPAIGLTAPVVTGKGFTGNTVTTESTGTPTLLVFLAHWCPNCQREVPQLVDWEKSGQTPTGIDVMAIATGSDPANPNYPPSEWLVREEFPVLWPVLADSADNKAGEAFGLTGYPYFVLVDAEGKVFRRLSGEIPMDQLTAIINDMIGV
jgi:thiol-disulfide isomerase/thioredoxin